MAIPNKKELALHIKKELKAGSNEMYNETYKLDNHI